VTDPQPNDLLSGVDVAAALDITPGRVRQLARQHDLGRSLAGARVYTPADVAAMRERNTRRGPAKAAE